MKKDEPKFKVEINCQQTVKFSQTIHVTKKELDTLNGMTKDWADPLSPVYGILSNHLDLSCPYDSGDFEDIEVNSLSDDTL